jgi:hypothetical protein
VTGRGADAGSAPLDGVFAQEPEGAPRFVQLPRLASIGVAELLATIRSRVLHRLATRGVMDTTQDLALLPSDLPSATRGSRNSRARPSPALSRPAPSAANAYPFVSFTGRPAPPGTVRSRQRVLSAWGHGRPARQSAGQASFAAVCAQTAAAPSSACNWLADGMIRRTLQASVLGRHVRDRFRPAFIALSPRGGGTRTRLEHGALRRGARVGGADASAAHPQAGCTQRPGRLRGFGPP